jgi:hypothetical protein
MEGKIAGLLEFRWWICGVKSTFWYYNVCLTSLVCGESGSIMNTCIFRKNSRLKNWVRLELRLFYKISDPQN